MAVQTQTARDLGSVDWEILPDVVRTFRQALDRGERPLLGDFVPEGSSNRTTLLVELIHEEMQYRNEAGEPFRLETYINRFGELAADSQAVDELVAAEMELRRRANIEAPTSPDLATPTAGDAAEVPIQLDRYLLGDLIGRGAFGVVYRAWDPSLNRIMAIKGPRGGVLDGPGSIEGFSARLRVRSFCDIPESSRFSTARRRRRALPGECLGRGPQPRRPSEGPPSHISPFRRMDRRAGQGIGARPRLRRDPSRRRAVKRAGRP